jgi:hypothetical protein
MRTLLLYSRRSRFEGFILISLTGLIAVPNNTLFYRSTVKKFKCIIYFRENNVVFEHLSELTGQRIAKITTTFEKLNGVIICVSWNKIENQLGLIMNDTMKYSRASDEPYKVRFDRYGVPIIIHKDAIAFKEISHPDGEVSGQKAIDHWHAILTEIQVLLDEIKGKDNYIFCLEIYKNCVNKIVTGLEVYLKSKFIELEEIPIRLNELSKFVKSEKKLELRKEIASHFSRRDILENIVSKYRKEFNFQDWNKSKDLFRKIYDIKFREIPGINDQLLSRIQDDLIVRHRINHTDMVGGILDMREQRTESSTKLDIAFVNRIKSDFNFFVSRLEEYSETKVNDDFIFNT